MSEGRAFPRDVDAEKGVLASLLLAPVDVRAFCSAHDVTADVFYLPAHQILFEAATFIVDSARPLDFLTLASALRDAGKLDAIGGAPYINELFGFLPSAANVKAYTEAVLEKRLRRRAIEIGTRLTAEAYGIGGDALEMVAEAHGQIGELLLRKGKRASVRDVLKEIIAEVLDGRDDVGLLKTGVEGMDGRLELFRGDLLVISAPTSCGKSALAFQIAFSLAKMNQRVALYPLEMKQKQTLRRALAQLGGDNADFLRKLVKSAKASGVTSQQTQKLLDAFAATAGSVALMPIHLRDDLHGFEAIRADLRTEAARGELSFVVVDYLQLLQSERNFERKQLAIAHFTQGFKLLAKELDCVICIPSQVNKEGGTREAQDAENDASSLIKIHGEEDKNGDVHPGRVSVWKQREGARHVDLPFVFNPAFTRFDYREVTS